VDRASSLSIAAGLEDRRRKCLTDHPRRLLAGETASQFNKRAGCGRFKLKQPTSLAREETRCLLGQGEAHPSRFGPCKTRTGEPAPSRRIDWKLPIRSGQPPSPQHPRAWPDRKLGRSPHQAAPFLFPGATFSPRAAYERGIEHRRKTVCSWDPPVTCGQRMTP
jgi:hypothetical protein